MVTMTKGYTLADGREVEVGKEVTVKWESSLSGKTIKYRAVFRGMREEDGSLKLWRPNRGYYAAPGDAEVTIHRSLTLGGMR